MSDQNSSTLKAPTVGSQLLLQRAVADHPQLLEKSFRLSGALAHDDVLTWHSPLASGEFKEYRDATALAKLGLADRLSTPLSEFWPARGAVWDGLATTKLGFAVLVEAKAHIPEAASPPCKASPNSLIQIQKSLVDARRILAPKSRADWTGVFYQYANRLAFQLFLNRTNAIPSTLVFLNFTNAVDVRGPSSEEEWRGAIRLLHAVLGLPEHLEGHGVFHAFIDAREITSS